MKGGTGNRAGGLHPWRKSRPAAGLTMSGVPVEVSGMKPFRVCLLLLISAGSAMAGPAREAADLSGLTRAALSGDAAAVIRLREEGPAGLAALVEAASVPLSRLRLNQVRLDAPESSRVREAVDTVAGQRDGWASGLYWFTDLDAARAEAARTGRRILSLRLLGNLNEEYCCANSRFFRSVLYANQAVAQVLRDRYVLHWKSVRPAPLLTIDMGDGRRIKRTITGNSIHYVLGADGKVIDALPGIYSPAAFLQALEGSREKVAGKSEAERRAWHGREAHILCMEWLAAAVQAGVYGEKMSTSLKNPEQVGGVWRNLVKEAFPSSSAMPGEQEKSVTEQSLFGRQNQRFNEGVSMPVSLSSEDIMELIGQDRRNPASVERIREFPLPSDFDPPKGMVERPILKQTLPPQTKTQDASAPKVWPGNANEALDPASPAQPGPSLAGRMTPAWWGALASPCRPWVRLDEASRRMMMQKLPEEVMTAAELKTGQAENAATPFGRLLGRFEEAISRDMVRNEYYYHTQIHQWLEEDKEGKLSGDVEALNSLVYQELFLTPDYDAWLGLVPEDTYTALEKDGCACDKGAPPMRKPER